ncbi:TPA: restriction endonuclease subunit S [Escherichia coli]|uniref:Type I restriction-modification system, specifi n=2 Tax=Escherichia coli TaxID=562 RepID=A0A649Z483_ECOLX|nr:restriction endonuclease subunit S [Escherichia coli]AXZ75948.1 restriction endonuclease subunit S [Escherichia coli]AZW07201.1 restriction endonuclease subunit S [Escherichia coli]EEW1774473.1 restriction endonuclease subunit S [Escherichia coli]EFK2377909.1 restriction endonuclease subunit S [Escherichia coli]EFN1982648.1 restriction endonuclease subunit S [Escherichia coli]
MSELSYLEKLMDGVEVEWLPLSKVFNLRNGYTPSKTKKEFWANGDIPWFRMDDIRENGRILGSSLQKISSCAVKGGKLFPENSILISTSATIGEHALITVPHLANQRFTCLALKESYADCFDIKFLFYYCFSLAEWCRKNTTMSSFASVDMDGFKKFLIPRPCPDNPEKSLAIQSEIVRILDKFSELTAELTAELNMRKKQYNYYRDQLLRFKEGEVEWKTLGEIGDFTYGYAAKAMDSGDARFVRITDINKDGKLSKENPMYVELNEENEKYTLDKNDLLMARTGATFGKTMIFEEDYPAVYAGFLIKLNLNKTIINAKYYWHFAQSDFFWEQANKLVSGGGQPQFNANALKQVRVPIPYPSHPQKSLDEQGRIVDILDKFDAIAASITEGLPREIELRQKQYEYYRDLLLSFPKPETVSK